MTRDPGDALRDAAVALSLEDPEPSRSTVALRLRQAHPDLPRGEADALARLCQDVHDRACALMARVYRGELPHAEAIDELTSAYPFLSTDTVHRLHSLGMYAAWRS